MVSLICIIKIYLIDSQYGLDWRKKSDVSISLYRQGYGGQGRIYPGAYHAFLLP